jgi:ketosteroid isomerase-like protein
MSQENVEIVRRVYGRWARGDFSQGDVFHPEVEFSMPDWPEGANTRGLDAMRQTWLSALSAWDDFHAEPGRFFEAGEHVVVLTNVRARGKGSGAETHATTATVWTVNERGKVIRLALYWDAAKALAAVGLSE